MKRIQAEYPYNDYWLYKVWHRKEGRYQANLILKSDIKIRTTLSYARYLMSCSVGRILDKNEEVDHIDNDKSNDDITNLQILSKEENKKKQEDYNRSLNPIKISLPCSHCGNIFEYPANNYRYHTKRGRKSFCCSRSCSTKYQHRLKSEKEKDEVGTENS